MTDRSQDLLLTRKDKDPPVAAIDIGTNSVLLLVAQKNNKNRLNVLLDIERVPRLGENLSETNKLSITAQERTILSLKEYLSICLNYGVSHIQTVSTYVLRKAKNRDEFLYKCKKIGIDVKVLSEQEEAIYSFDGAVFDFPYKNLSNIMVVDVGGGSTELVSKKSPPFIKSIPIGAVTLTNLFIKNDPPKNDEISKIKKYIEKELNKISAPSVADLIGIGGTITTLASIKQKLATFNPYMIDHKILTKDEINEQIIHLSSLNLVQRSRLPGLFPGREDIIIAGALIFLAIMEWIGIKEILVTVKGLRYGIVKSILGK
ncbi:MAG: Ppx/GppA family phosphatase [Deltaproteobacteria bacterium]|nr:Ppx/GppA family phosphatase [Deltaproteobacteria bacterium]